MHITHLHELGWNHFFQSQLTLEMLETSLPFRVTGVEAVLQLIAANTVCGDFPQ
ncbi:MAG: hypothetical protein QJT81_02105 [Candidatus Thiothrix putei]|uniref:Uncharacterized protein n=1 Tax=Candidatus Thiothrix putei TaxID=3080811 RepID=A0AA95HHB5_9GAMM|nr:MAG: hypothetical protein QJT81_02105 [Candidatus Thiothrix putei]